MITKVEVMSEKDFNSWYKGGEAAEEKAEGEAPEAAQLSKGAALVQVKGCVACHSTDGTKKVGPSFKGLFGKKEIVIHDGKEREIAVDEAFVKEKMLPEINRTKGSPRPQQGC
jgi:cytochrome c oxidase subunit 2